MPGSELEVGAESLFPQVQLASSFGPFAGSNSSDSGVFTLPTMGLVYRLQNSAWTYGFGIFAAGGFAVNYPASTTNPILFPQAAGGLGPLAAQLRCCNLCPRRRCRSPSGCR